MHSPRFVLVDREGAIRGYFRGDEPDSVRQVTVAVKKLLAD